MRRIINPVLILLLLVLNGNRVNESHFGEELVPIRKNKEVNDTLAIKHYVETGVPVYRDSMFFQLIPGDRVFQDVNELRVHFEKIIDFMASFDVYRGQIDDFPYLPEWDLSTCEAQKPSRINEQVVLSSWTTSVDFRKVNDVWQISRIHVSQQ